MRRLALALLLLAAAPAAAQTVTLRTGNHPTFARMVIDLPPDRAWELGRIGPDYALDLGAGLAVDVTGAFDRIPRDRIADLEMAGDTGRLMLRIACACHARAFPYGPDKLVIDVVDGPPPPASPFEAERPATAAGPAAVSADTRPGAESTAAPQAGDSLLQLPLIAQAPPPPMPFPLRIAPDATTAAGTTTAETAISAAPEQIEGLAADMARAVAAGILDATDTTPAVAGSPPAAAGDLAEAPPPDPGLLALPAAPASGPGISFIPADRLDRTTTSARELSRTGLPCRPDSDFDFASWGQTGDFSTDVGALRLGIIDPAGAVDDAKVTALARAYLHFGFGAEARQTLALGGQDSTANRLLGHLADLVDGRPVPPAVFADQQGCLTPVALWMALARGSIEGSTVEERTAIEAAFRVLPPGPRHAIAPRLAALFLAAGQSDGASAILDRMPPQGTATEEMIGVQSDVLRAASSAVAAREALLTAIRNGTRASAGTMIRLVDATLAAGLPVDPWMIETLTTLRFEYRETGIAGPLASFEIRALTASGGFADAQALLADPALPILPADRQDLTEQLVLALAERGSDADLLAFAFESPLPMPGGAAANAVADRLIGLGFPDIALDILTPPAPPAEMGERRLLRAGALRALGQDEEAARILAGMDDPGAMPADGTGAWRAGDWDALQDSDDPLLTAVAAAVRDDTARPAGDNSLAGRAALIDAAAETRKLAEELLARFPAPGAAE